MTKDEFQATLKSLWARSDSIFFEVLTAEGLFTRPIDLRNPLVFYLGHLPGFNYIHVKLRVCGEEPFNPKVRRRSAAGRTRPNFSEKIDFLPLCYIFF
jgi:hypothetical protein